MERVKSKNVKIVGWLEWDCDYGEGYVVYDGFDRLGCVDRKDALQDYIHELDHKYYNQKFRDG
jgi:hypothetical protein